MKPAKQLQLSTSAPPALLLVVLACASPAAADDHLLLSELQFGPETSEFIEIVNATDQVVALDDYYLSDEQDYAKTPGWFGGSPLPEIGVADFIVRFPAGASLAPGEVVIIAMQGAGFFNAFGFRADFEVRSTDALTPNMLHVGGGGGAPTLSDFGECMILFHWDGASDLVSDVDLLRWGQPTSANDLSSKTGLQVDGPDRGNDASTYLPDAFTMPTADEPPAGQSLKRISAEGANETASGGNGLTGHDETTENILLTWDFGSFTAPNPGVANLDSPPIADVSIEIVGPITAPAGSNVSFTLTLSNLGTLPASEIDLTTDLPAGVAFIAQNHDRAGLIFEQAGSNLQWSATSLNYNSACDITLEVSLEVGLSGEVEFVINVATTSVESDAKNNTASLTLSIENEAACTGDFVSGATFQPPPDGAVDAADLAYLLGDWGTINLESPADMVTSATFQPPPDGIVDAADLAVLLGAWGACP